MTAWLPDPLPLELPRADPDVLEQVASAVQAASYLLGVVETTLRGPAGRAPTWAGDDADAARAKVRTLTELAADISRAQRIAASRVALHRDCLLDVTRRIRALVVQQDDDYAAAWRRMGALSDPALEMLVGTPEAVAIVEEFRAAEAARNREHGALLADLADDAAATARVLAECSHVLGGNGRPGDEWRVVAHLALVLPGWGDVELAARGADLAQLLLGQATWEERERWAEEAAGYAGNPAFGRAFLEGLGTEGMGLLLNALGSGLLRPDGEVARVLAAALGAPPAGQDDPVREVREGLYLRADDGSVNGQLTAAGMALVLAAGARLPRGGPSPEVLLSWSRQLLLNEHQQDGQVAGGAFVPVDGDVSLGDPAALALGLLLDAGEAAPAAALLGDRVIWEALLSRFWGDGGQALSDLVDLAAADTGPGGDGAVRTGLEAIGAGLDPVEPGDRTVDRGNVSLLAPTLGAALAAHVDVAVDLLWVGVDGRAGGRADGLRGLGVVAVDGTALHAVAESVQHWLDDHPSATGFQPAAGNSAVPAVGLPNALLAAWRYGDYLEFALDESEKEAEAIRRRIWWDNTVGQVRHVPGLAGIVLAQVEHLAAVALRMDGTWDEGSYPYWIDWRSLDGTGFDPLGAKDPIDVDAVTTQAGIAFDQASAVLGVPVVPESPPVDLWAPTRNRLGALLGN